MEVTLIESMGSDLTVVNAARVSFAKESELEWQETHSGSTIWKKVLKKSDKGLIKYLAKHKHTSPFGHCFASFRVKAPIFVARQLVKHKFLRWNEVSRRYVSDPPEFYNPSCWRLKADNVKQGSSSEVVGLCALDQAAYDKTMSNCLDMYQVLLNQGVCAEQARMVLPQNMMTEWWWSGSLDAWADMCKLRLDPHSQLESQIVAKKISKEMEKEFPISWKELLK